MALKTYNNIKVISIFLIVLLFAYTGFSKLLDHAVFLNQLSQVAFLKPFKTPMSIILPILEIITAILLCIRRTENYGLSLAAILMTGFTIYVSAMLLSNSKLPCTCGGVISSMTWKQHLYFNIFFTLLCYSQLISNYRQNN